jgi:hypothetical protein
MNKMQINGNTKRVKLKINLEKYGKGLIEGTKGYTIPNIKLSAWGSSDRFVAVKFKSEISGDINQYVPECDNTIELESIFHYCDLMNSSFGICCFYSGSMVLASAVQRFNEDLKILCITSPSVYNSDRTQKLGIFYFDYVDYIVTK